MGPPLGVPMLFCPAKSIVSLLHGDIITLEGWGGGRERERENMSLLSYFFIPITKQSWAILGLRLSNPRNMSESRSPFKPVSDSAHAGDPRVRISTLFFLLQKFKKNHGIPASQELNPCGGIAYRVAGV